MGKKIAFVYDWFDTSVGGAERVIQALHEKYPQAPWYTSHIDHASAPWAKDWDVRPSFLQRLPIWFRRNRILSLLLLPFAFESFDFSSYDVVVSVSSGFAKNIVTRADTRHICYLLSPPRWLWKEEILNPKSEILRSIEAFMKRKLKNWDYGGAQRVDEFVSISQEVAKRCKTYYDRESEVVYPPFDYEKWKNLVANSEWRIANGNEDIPLPYFLVVSRLEPYKRVEVAMEAFHKYKVLSTQYKEKAQKITLAIVGSGSQKSRLKALSSRLKIEDSIVWVEKVSDKELAWLYAHCKAFIMPQEEDYGYVACEAAACGAPIVAYANGGQIEPLSDYPNKILCDEQSAQCFAQALEKIGDIRYNAQTYENSHLRRGSRNTFVAAFSQKIAETV